MDTRAQIRRDHLRRKTRTAIFCESNAIGASATEALDALLDTAARIYAADLSGAMTSKEKFAARRAFIRGMFLGMDDLPRKDVDDIVEAKLRGKT